MTMRLLAIVVAALVALAALILVIQRGGVLAWLVLMLAAGLLLKVWRKPSSFDLPAGLALLVLPSLVWIGVQQYVIATWESGEVVELAFDTEAGPHTVRLWVMDLGASPTVYYDAGPQAAKALLAAEPVQFTRAGQTTTRIPAARLVDELTASEADRVLNAMAEKYGDRNHAATIYYVMLGRAQDRVGLVVDLKEI